MDKLTQVKQELAIYANDKNIPEAAVIWMEKLVENNVSYDDADNFCEEHFINNIVADNYKAFYLYLQEKLSSGAEQEEASGDRNGEIVQLIESIQEQLDLLRSLIISD